MFDLDGDGRVDIVQYHHNECCGTIHFANGNSLTSYTRARWNFWFDTHSIAPFHPDPSRRERYVAISVGGMNGNKLSRPYVVRVTANRRVTLLSNRHNPFPQSVSGRGRALLFFKINGVALGGIKLNAPPNQERFKTRFHHQIFSWDLRQARFRDLNNRGALAADKNYHGGLTDIDNDGKMELVLFEHMRIYRYSYTQNRRGRVTSARFNEITSSLRIAPTIMRNRRFRSTKGVSGFAEVDLNNDGWWDMYVTRSSLGDLRWLRQYTSEFNSLPDIILLNQGGKFFNQARGNAAPPSSISRNSHRGIAYGDFDNNGYVDIYLCSQSSSHDTILLNHDAGKRYDVIRVKRRTAGPGDMAYTLDADGDGYLDIIVSTGDWHRKNQRGSYSLLRNTGRNSYSNFIIVYVGASPKKGVSNLHAVVKVKLAGRNGRMMRRIGGHHGPGTGQGLIEYAHFGLGRWKKAAWILVQWTNGERQWFTNVDTKSKLRAGRR